MPFCLAPKPQLFKLFADSLLGIVIVLGMLVDDAVVLVEAMYFRMERGMQALDAALDSIREFGLPVLAAVATTIAAFLPLMLLPGIVGKRCAPWRAKRWRVVPGRRRRGRVAGGAQGR